MSKPNFIPGLRPKIFDLPQDVIKRENLRLIDDHHYFWLNQHMLLWMANQKYGRQLLCIPQNFPKITEFGRHWITAFLGQVNGRNKYVTKFYIGAKFANVIRFRWKLFREYQQEYYRKALEINAAAHETFFPKCSQKTRGIISINQTLENLAYATTSNFAPDTGSGSTTIDGWLRAYIGTTWTGSRNATSCTNVDAGTYTAELLTYMNTSDPNVVNDIRRNHYGYDTSTVDDTDTVDSAIHTIVHDRNGTGSDKISLVKHNPGADNAIVVGDWDLNSENKFGTTLISDTETTCSTTTTGSDLAYTLNTTGEAWIDFAGVTNFGIMGRGDRINVFPNAQTSGTYYVDRTGTTEDPDLQVVHTAAPTATPGGTAPMMGI